MALDLKNYEPALAYGANIGVQVDLTDIVDSNGNELIELDATASSVNYLRISNAAASSRPTIAAVGTDTNIGINITAKGSGIVVIDTTSGSVQSNSVIRAMRSLAIPAGGTAGAGLTFSATANFGVFFGSSTPTLLAAKGSLYLRSDGSTTNDRAYIATDAAGTWTALTTAA